MSTTTVGRCRVQILFDIDRAANAVNGLEPENPPREIQVVASGARRGGLSALRTECASRPRRQSHAPAQMTRKGRGASDRAVPSRGWSGPERGTVSAVFVFPSLQLVLLLVQLALHLCKLHTQLCGLRDRHGPAFS